MDPNTRTDTNFDEKMDRQTERKQDPPYHTCLLKQITKKKRGNNTTLMLMTTFHMNNFVNGNLHKKSNKRNSIARLNLVLLLKTFTKN